MRQTPVKASEFVVIHVDRLSRLHASLAATGVSLHCHIFVRSVPSAFCCAKPSSLALLELNECLKELLILLRGRKPVFLPLRTQESS